MLLAFELFVVVVAVDARWVEEALRTSYPWLTTDEGGVGSQAPGKSAAGKDVTVRVTPQDYLEKIFQISFWLEPMTAARTASYLASLIRTPQRESGPVVAPGVTIDQPEGTGAAVAAGTKVDIAAIELDYTRALAAYVGPSPRRVKRLVNAYRLIKARMPDAQLKAFLTDRESEGEGLRSGPYQIVIGLLVIGTGAPSSGTRLLKELAEWDPRDAWDNVVESFRKRNHPDWSMAAQVIETLMRTQKAKDVSELRGWARKVSRFLLHSHVADLQRVGGRAAAPPKPKPAAAKP